MGAPVGPVTPVQPTEIEIANTELARRLTAVESFIAGLNPFLAVLYEAGKKGGGGGGGKGGKPPGAPAAAAGTALNHCEWVQVWINGTANPKDCTAQVNPVNPPNGFPPGSQIDVFAGPNPPPAPPQGQATPPLPACPATQGSPPGQWPTLPSNPPGNNSACVTVPNGQALYIHYNKGNSQTGGISVSITVQPG